jgi:hypothetical protein
MDGLVLVRDPAGGVVVLTPFGTPMVRVMDPRPPAIVAGGFRGVPGQPGAKGDAGDGIRVLGTYATLADLQAAHPTGAVGDAYAVGGDLYVWDGDTGAWANAGAFRGPAGSNTITVPVGAVVQGLSVVRTVAGNAYPVDTTVDAHAEQVVGLALQSVTTVGMGVTVQTSGLVTDAGWAFSDGAVFCGANGALTQSPAATGWLLRVGRAVSPTSLLVDIETPIYRG